MGLETLSDGASNDFSGHDATRPKMSIDHGAYRQSTEISPLLRPTEGLDRNKPSPLSLHDTFREEDEDQVEDDDVDGWDEEDDSQEPKSTWYMFLLTVCMVGLQMGWSVEMSYGSPYLLSLGISKAMLGLVWIAGPLTGTLVQPYIGNKSDNCRSKYGKRRPFIVGGGVATIVSLVALAWSREIVAGAFWIIGVSSDSDAVAAFTIIWAVVMIYVLDFAINVFQAIVRAFIVDCSPTHQQSQANAWAARFSGAANIFGFMFGFADLPGILPWLGDSQFKVLCVLSCTVIVLTTSISCLSITEKDPRREKPSRNSQDGLIAFFRTLYHAMWNIPLQIKRVCQVQFLAWIGWFPFLFYTTTFIGNLYVDPFFRAEPNMPKEQQDILYEKGTRVANLALMAYAFVSLSCSVILPQLIQQAAAPRKRPAITPMTPGCQTPGRLSRNSSGYFNTPLPKRSRMSKLLRYIKRRAPSTHITGLTLRKLFILSHIAFAIIIWIASFASTTQFATLMVGLVGLPWSVTMWVPFALIAAEISKRNAIRRGQIEPPDTAEGRALANGDDKSQGADQAGIVLGIHNLCLSAPQILATLLGSIIFKFLQKPRGVAGDNSVAWVFRLGGVCALVAAYLATKIEEDDYQPDDDGLGGGGGH